MRYAMILERATVWDISSEGFAVEFKGDSLLLICSWLQGKWSCENRGYCRRTAAMIDCTSDLAACFNMRPAASG
eukprot:6956949-Pyramimonas_sp.AAC.1